MSHRIAINGFGRIGRTVFRAWSQRPEAQRQLTLVAINELADAQTVAHLARYDSTHGRFQGDIALHDDVLEANGRKVQLLSMDDIDALPWDRLAINTVLECTGAFTERSYATQHLEAGAQRVLLSQPARPDVDATLVWGVNESTLKREHQIVSAGSCTSNALCPVLQVLDAAFGISAGTITTIHSAMNDQPVLDAYHHTDLRKTRAAFQSIIPVDTGLAVGIPRILPQLEGKLTAHALRVPTLNVSAMDLAVYTEQDCDIETVNRALQSAADASLSGILGFTTEPLASCDFNGESCSGVVDASQTQVSQGRLVKVLIWFDNEWAYANRLLDVALRFAQFDAELPVETDLPARDSSEDTYVLTSRSYPS